MKFTETHYAIVVCLFVLLAMSFAGWYENYVPPMIDQERVCRATDGCNK